MNQQNDIIFSVEPLDLMMFLNLSDWVSPTETQNSFTYHGKTVTSYSVNHRRSLDGCLISLGIFLLNHKNHHKTLWLCTNLQKADLLTSLPHIIIYKRWNIFFGTDLQVHIWFTIYNINPNFACYFTWIRGKDEVTCKNDVGDKSLTSGLSSHLTMTSWPQRNVSSNGKRM